MMGVVAGADTVAGASRRGPLRLSRVTGRLNEPEDAETTGVLCLIFAGVGVAVDIGIGTANPFDELRWCRC
jgi:hypothetical protein